MIEYKVVELSVVTDESIEEGGLGIMSVAGAMDVSPTVSFGASLDIWMNDFDAAHLRIICSWHGYSSEPDAVLSSMRSRLIENSC